MHNVIVALDFSSVESVENFLDNFDTPIFVKIGMELYYQTGPKIIQLVKDRGHKIFLDLKLHDIPNTVENAMAGLAKLGVDMTNVHAAGGVEMMKAAKRGLGDGAMLIAVTQLTSTSQENMKREQLIDRPLEESVLNYAKMAEEAGLDGVVCSPLEARLIHENLREGFETVTPGIRFNSHVSDDQKRITTPKQARLGGSSYIVVGRPITQAEHPYDAYLEIVKDWEAGK